MAENQTAVAKTATKPEPKKPADPWAGFSPERRAQIKVRQERYRNILARHTKEFRQEIPEMLKAAVDGQKKYKGKPIPSTLTNIAAGLSGMVEKLAADATIAEIARLDAEQAAEAAKAAAEAKK